ncbi:MAG: 50S ribosomal protein L25 [bacterium]|nr:50S ribosomal protein L25 [bacterium]
MSALQLQATKRTEKVNKVRNAEAIPAILYGHGIAAESLALPYASFIKVWRAAGESTLVDVEIDGAQPRKALIHDVQLHPLTERLLHVDLYAVQMTEKMKTKIPVRFIGEAPAVKAKGGLLVKSLSHVSVECLPGDLVHEMTVDITHLDTFGQSIYIKNLVAPKGITILDRAEEPVVTVMRPKTEDELAKELSAETADVKVEDAVKVQEKGKKEEEGVEGADAKSGDASAKGAAGAKGGAASGGKPAAKGGKGGDDKKK